MGAAIIVIVYFLVVIFLLIRSILFLFTRNSEKHLKDAINEFDKNKKAFDEIDISSDYNLGSGHIYQ